MKYMEHKNAALLGKPGPGGFGAKPGMRNLQIFDDNGRVVYRNQVRPGYSADLYIDAGGYKRTGEWQDAGYLRGDIAPVARVNWFSRTWPGVVAVVAAALVLAVYAWLFM